MKSSNRVEALIIRFAVSTLASAMAGLVFYEVLGAESWRNLASILACVAVAAFLATLAFGPKRWIADPSISGSVGRDYPWLARVICLVGVIMFAGVAVLSSMR